jgi:hypothetical protein
MSSSTRLQRAALVVMVTVGVLSMHGLASAPASHDNAPAIPTELTSGTQHHPSTDQEHSPLHAVGELCLWLIVGGALALGAIAFTRTSIARRADVGPTTSRPSTRPAPLGRSPDPTLATTVVRC